MKVKISPAIALAMLLMSAGCQKKIHSPSTTGSLVSTSKGSTSGLGGFPIFTYARCIAFDYEGHGLTNILGYIPGSDAVDILKNINNVFTPIFTEAQVGIGGYHLTAAPANVANDYNEIGGDHIIAYDYNGTGHQDHLVIYRPGSGFITILQYDANGNFTPIYSSSSGIGGYDLMSPYDKIITFDYDHSGFRNYLCLYRPGSGAIWMVHNIGTPSSPFFSSVIQGTHGIGGFDLASTNDQVMALDYDGTGKMDHLILYRPGGISGNRAFWLVQHGAGTTFTAEWHTQTGLPGIDLNHTGFDLSQPQDRIIGFDYTQTGVINCLLCYRPGPGLVVQYGPIDADNVHEFNLISTTGGGGFGQYPFFNNPTSLNGYVGDKCFTFDDQNQTGMHSFVAYAPGTDVIDVMATPNPNVLTGWIEVY